MEKADKIYVAGHNGMVGSAIVRLLKQEGFKNIITADRTELNLTNQIAVRSFLAERKPDYVILAAAKVGGIHANLSHPAQFLYENLAIQNNVIHYSHESGVKKLIFLGSSCIYPKDCPQPIKEEYLLTGKLEPTNEGYALAKIAGLKMVEYYHQQYGFQSISLMPCNLYGTNDHFDPQTSHVLSALVKKFVDATEAGSPEVTMWGTGNARREFMHVDDLARAVLFMIHNYNSREFINVGWGEDISINELATIIAKKVNYRGKIIWDHTKPDGMMKRCMDVSRMRALGFTPQIALSEGIDGMIGIYKKLKAQPI
jgi:GDP-L-fucose synthase